MKGLSQYRSDADNGGSITSIIVNNRIAAKLLADGSAQSLGLQDVVSIWPVEVPLFSNLVNASAAPGFSVTYLGVETVNNTSCSKIQISANIQPVDPITAITSLTGSIIVWLDAATGMPVQLQYTKLASDNPTATISRVRQFSNYQQVSGMQVAFTQQEFVDGRLLYTIQLSAANFNVGLTDADFALPNAQ